MSVVAKVGRALCEHRQVEEQSNKMSKQNSDKRKCSGYVEKKHDNWLRSFGKWHVVRGSSVCLGSVPPAD